MGNVINLPEKPVMEWLRLEKRLRDQMVTAGMDREIIDHVLTVGRPVWLDSVHTDIKFERTDDFEEAMKKINDWFGDYSFRLFYEVIVREVELYELRGKK